jgi:hypothetical protein
MNDFHVRSGAVIALRLFDIAYSIDLKRIEAITRETCRGSTVRSSLLSAPVKSLAFDVPPVLLTLPPLILPIEGRSLECPLTVRFYDFGVVAISLRFPAKDMPWSGFGNFANAVDRAVGPGGSLAPWNGVLNDLRETFSTAFHRPNATLFEEDHLVTVVQEWEKPMTTAELQDSLDLVPLLSGESRPLAAKAREELLRHRFSYYEDDLVVMTWDRAFIYEPRNDSDVADILEVANAQLLEFRYYDELLDDELPRMYEMVRRARRPLTLLASRRFADLARRLYTLVAEVTELTEKAENVLRVTEDVYLARVYLAALGIFRVPTVSASVQEKLAIIRDTYAALYAEASSARGEMLEFAIILLIVIEIGIALARHAT